MKEILFSLICSIHILFWLFVTFAFLTKNTAYYNIYYIIPITYILHMFPFHILISCKSKL